MPIVTTETIHFDGVDFSLKYCVDRKGVWSLKLPASLVERLGTQDHAYADTLDELKKEWKRLWKEYKEASTSTERIIAWKTEIKARIRADEELLINKAELSFADGLALSLSVGVFDRHTTKTGSKVHTSFDLVDNVISSSAEFRIEYWDWEQGLVKWMPWTQEREDFFAQLVTAFENIILRLNNFLGDNSEKKLIEIIDQHLPLLPTRTETK